MSSQKYHCLSDLTSGSYDWKVKARIIRSWRFTSKKGESTKGLNILLLDDKDTRMHCFVPGNVINKHETKLKLGNICSISNFSVKEYGANERFRCINSERQMILTTYTEVTTFDVDDLLIAKNMFDFYDLSDLSQIADKNIFLTDVIGVIEKTQPKSSLINKFGEQQVQVKFNIVDPRCSINVTFWDSLADEFEKSFNLVDEFPAIIIIASAKITSWKAPGQNSPQVEVGNASSTTFYINLDDQNVHQLRKIINTPQYSKYDFSSQIPKEIPVMTIDEINNLEMDYTEKEVISEVKFKTVSAYKSCFIYECSSCYEHIRFDEGKFKCYRCSNRDVPHPYKRWFFGVEAEDITGTISIFVTDREARILLGVDAEDIEWEENQQDTVPPILKTLENKFYTVKILLKPLNNEEQTYTHYVSGIVPHNTCSTNDAENMQESMTQASGSSMHLDDFSQLNFDSPDPTKKKKRIVQSKKNRKQKI